MPINGLIFNYALLGSKNLIETSFNFIIDLADTNNFIKIIFLKMCKRDTRA